MAKRKRGPDHPDNWLDGLHSDSVVQRWHTCRRIQPGTGHEKRLMPRLLELLFDPVAWDQSYYVAVEAFEAIVRLDKTGCLWLKQVSRAVQTHSRNGDGDIAVEMMRTARTVMEPWDYLQWMNQTVPTPDEEQHWVKTVIDWLPHGWTEDEELVRHMLYALDPADSDRVWLELCILECQIEGCLPETDASGGTEENVDRPIMQYLAGVRRWAEEAPTHIRERAALEVEQRRGRRDP